MTPLCYKTGKGTLVTDRLLFFIIIAVRRESLYETHSSILFTCHPMWVMLGDIFSAMSTTIITSVVMALADAVANNVGREFYLHQRQSMAVLVTTQKTSDVRVTVTAPGFRRDVMVRKGVSATVEVPGTDRAPPGEVTPNRMIRVTADDDVAVSTISRGSCGVSLTLPVDRLGLDYYVLTWAPAAPAAAEVSILAVEDNTRVTVTLTAPVRFAGADYAGGETLTATLAQYDAVELQSTGDLSGTRVTADRPVSVNAGNTDGTLIGTGTLADQLVAQVPPTNTWGRHFAAVPFPGTTSGYYVKVGASRGTSSHCDARNETDVSH